MTLGIVAGTITTLLLIAAVGAALRLRGLLDDRAVRGLGRIAVDVCFPALIFTQLLATTTAEALVEGAWLVAFGVLAVSVPWLVGPRVGLRPTVAYLAGLPNWIFLPLPIAAAAYGGDGVRVVLLVNVGAMAALWTLGVATLRPGRGGEGMLNPGSVATVVGLLVAVIRPPTPGPEIVWTTINDTLEMLAAPTIPLSMIVTGAAAAAAPRPSRDAWLVTVLRLVVWPLATLAALAGLVAAGVALPRQEALICVLIAGMPVAASATAFADRFGGDAPLAAQTLLLTTPLAWISVPALLAAARLLGL